MNKLFNYFFKVNRDTGLIYVKHRPDYALAPEVIFEVVARDEGSPFLTGFIFFHNHMNSIIKLIKCLKASTVAKLVIAFSNNLQCCSRHCNSHSHCTRCQWCGTSFWPGLLQLGHTMWWTYWKHYSYCFCFWYWFR